MFFFNKQKWIILETQENSQAQGVLEDTQKYTDTMPK